MLTMLVGAGRGKPVSTRSWPQSPKAASGLDHGRPEAGSGQSQACGVKLSVVRPYHGARAHETNGTLGDPRECTSRARSIPDAMPRALVRPKPKLPVLVQDWHVSGGRVECVKDDIVRFVAYSAWTERHAKILDSVIINIVVERPLGIVRNEKPRGHL
ncbi:hypothetical protein PYCCODRAFT_457386 [Trametes coccinea BRFM310]|uniref:Uncharacterized protein n=1 Tax=Trametes coccinea (strain BRFM310) TaxID=1353009 RepID=A0A1Y2ILB6_TRAC3|nr:hypothetical protein PYCCODRAFT_457386 [Trametes coccinea BRFM310]